MPTNYPYPGLVSSTGALRGSNATFLMQDSGPVPGSFLMSQYSGLEGQAAPPPPEGDHAHFDAIAASPNAVDSWPLRTLAEIASLGGNDWADNWSYDTGYDGAQLDFNPGQGTHGMTLSSNRQLFMDFTKVNIAQDQTTFSAQYEIMYDVAYNDLNGCPGWSGIHKTIRFDHRASSPGLDERVFEMNNDSLNVSVPKDYPAQPRLRLYYQAADGSQLNSIFHSAYDRSYPFSLYRWDDQGTRPGGPQTPQWDRQPSVRTSLDYNQISMVRESNHLAMAAGDVNEPFLHRANIWARVTLHWYWVADGELRFEIWMSDETTDPVQVFGHKDTDGNEGLGFSGFNSGSVVYPGVPNSGRSTAGDYYNDNSLDRIRAEFNSSGGGAPPTSSYKLWIRNFCVWKGAQIPLGGRPVKTGTIN